MQTDGENLIKNNVYFISEQIKMYTKKVEVGGNIIRRSTGICKRTHFR
ncbi:hypothetical protein KHA80_09430 [Anaerobacillus sp. HL2]|nr:hypothetical protein KHA80_09430 [Anaerobacillus sp. HL2]